ncbi:MAG: SUMF1/EgtB/PvdO family nonheme iron enzyme [Sandaracinaceae bacterium]
MTCSAISWSLLASVAMAGCYGLHTGRDAGPADADCELACECRDALPLPRGAGWVGVNYGPDFPGYQHLLTREVWLGKNKATAGCYRRCVEEGACTIPSVSWVIEEAATPGNSELRSDYFMEDRYANLPMIALSRSDAASYCSWLGGRLPTNGEWERAARGLEGRENHWSPIPDDPLFPEPPDGPVDLCAHLHWPSREAVDGCDRYPAALVEVGHSTPGLYGHLDLHSAPYEIVQDYYAPYPEGAVPPDYAGPMRDTGIRTLRGGPYGGARHTMPVALEMTREVTGWPYVLLSGVRCAFDNDPRE